MFFQEILKKAKSNVFFRNVATLASGTIISQIVVMLTSPLLTRMYSVEAFGLLSVFTSIVTFFAVAATGRYEYAIGLPEKDEEALNVVKLIITIGGFVSLFYFILVLIFKNILTIHDKSGFLESYTAYVAPLYVLLVAINSGYAYWYQRFKKYKAITVTNSLQVITTTIFSIIFGLLSVKEGMIYSLLFGVFFTNLYFFIRDKSLRSISFRNFDVLSVIKKYVSFPKYMILSDLSKTAGQQIIPVMFSVLYSTTIVGFFSLANRMLRLPNIIITSAIGNVFRNDAIDAIREKGNCLHLYKSTFKKLVIMALPIYTLIFIFSPVVFSLFFGEKWLMAGNFAQVLCILLVVEFVATPLSTLFYVRGKQKILMNLQMLNAFVGALAIYIGALAFSNPLYTLALFSFSSVLFNLILLILSFKIADGR